MSDAESSGAGPERGPEPGGGAPRGPRADAERERRTWVPVALVLFAAGLALLRFVELGTWSLWVDEAHSLHDSRLPSAALERYPLGYLLTRLVIGLRGGAVDELTLRLGPALFGALGIPLTFWGFAPVVGRRRAAFAALVVGVSGWHLTWSQTARAYTLMQDISLLGAGIYLRGLRGGRAAVVLAGLVVGSLAVFAHPSAALLLPAWVLAPLLLPLFRARLPAAPPRALLLTLGALGLALLGGWAVGVWRDYADAKAGTSLSHFALTTGFYVTPALGLAAAVGAAVALASLRPFDLLAALVCLTVGLVALAAASKVRVSAQYVFVLLPWIAVLATVPLAALRRRPVLNAAWIALLTLPGLVDCALYFGARHGNRPRWREAYAHVWNERGPNDLVFGMAAPVGEYYLAPRREVLRQHRSLVRLNPYTAGRPQLWSRRGRRIWFVVRHEDLATWEPEPRAALEQLLARECRLSLELPVALTPRDLTVRVYVREANGAP